MTTLAEISKRAENFKDFLKARGAEVLQPTNPYEVVRFAANGATSVIYRKNNGALTFTGHAAKAWKAFRDGEAWTVKTGAPPRKALKSSVMVRSLRERDGDDCFYCLKRVPEKGETDDPKLFASVEHLLSVTQGGKHHIANLVLTHSVCNQRAGHLSVFEKIKIREAAVLERAGVKS